MDDKDFYMNILNITKLSREKAWNEERSQIKSYIRKAAEQGRNDCTISVREYISNPKKLCTYIKELGFETYLHYVCSIPSYIKVYWNE